MMKRMEIWREIPGFPGNEASTLGRLRTYWYRVRNTRGRGSHRERWDEPRPIPTSLDDNGYLKCNIYCELNNTRYTRKVHVLVGITFLPVPDDFDEVDYTIDHVRSGKDGKLDNSVDNLQWLSRADNIRKAYRDGMCNARIRRQDISIFAYDTWMGEFVYFPSITIAAKELGVNYRSIQYSLRHYGSIVAKRYYFEYADGEDDLLYAEYEWDY